MVTELEYIRARILQLWDMGVIDQDDCGHHIWFGRWRDQPEAKIHSKRQGMMPYIWQADKGKPVPEGAKVYRTCGEKLCVNPEHYKCRAESLAVIRGSRTHSQRTKIGHYKNVMGRRLIAAQDDDRRDRLRHKAYVQTEGDDAV